MSEVNKIANYNQMMSWLTRPSTPKTQVADLVDDLEPGSLKDELKKDFDPSQETHEEYLQRKNLDRPFNAQDGGRANLAIGGGSIVGENLGTREGFAKAKYDDPRSNIKAGDELGKGIAQRNDLNKKKIPIYSIKGGANSFASAKNFEDAVTERARIVEEEGIRKGGPEVKNTWSNLTKDPSFKKFFKQQIDTNKNIQLAMKENNLTKKSSLEDIFNAFQSSSNNSASLARVGKKDPTGIVPSAFPSLMRTFEQVFKTNELKEGTLTLDGMTKKLNDLGMKVSKNYLGMLLRYSNPDYKAVEYPAGTADYLREQTRIRSAKTFKNKLDDLGVEINKIKNLKRPTRGGPDSKIFEGFYSIKASDSQLNEIVDSFKKNPPVFNILDDFSSQSRNTEEYKINQYSKDNQNIKNLKRNLNRVVDNMTDSELRNWVKKNSKLENLVSAYFDSESSEIKNRPLNEITDSQLRKNLRFENDHIRGRATVKYDEATKKILKTGGLDIEFPKNLYIIPRAINNNVKRTVENYVAKNPNETEKINKLNKFFKQNNLTYWDRNTNEYKGATPKITNTDLSHLGLTQEEILLSNKINLKNGELIIEKGPALLKNINERNVFLNELASKTNKPISEVKEDLTNVQKVFRKMKGQMNSGIDPKLLIEYLGAEVKDLAAFGSKYGGDVLGKVGKGVAGIDLPIFQTMFAASYDLEQDSPVWLTIPAAFTDEVSNMFNLYNKSEGRFGLGKAKDFGKFVASSFVPRVMRSPIFKTVSKVGKAGSFAAPVLELGKQAYLSEKRKGMLPDIARQFDIPIEEAKRGYDNFVRQSQIRGMNSMVDDTEIPEMSQQGKDNLNSLINSFKQLGSYAGVSEDPYAEKESIYTRGKENPMSLDRALYPNRQNFADGPKDPSKKGLGSLSKRQFLKMLTLIPAGILAIRGGPNILQKSKKAAEIVKRGADGVPAFINDLIAKVKLKAAEKGTKYFTGKSSDEFADVYQADNFVVTEQGNKTIIREVDDPSNPGYRENQIEIEVDPETGGVTYTEASARPDDQGKLKDVDEYIEDVDLENMRKYTYDE